MKTTGQILKTTRQAAKIETTEVSRITKIRSNFLTLIEADNYSQLPNGATARGFIRNYSEFLGLNPDYVLAVFRRDFVENPQGQIVPRSVVEPAEVAGLWTPKTTILAAVASVFVLLGAYLIYQYHLLTGPPSLSIDSPPDNIVVTQSTVEITGTTDPDATISVNGQLIALEKGGIFFLRVPLVVGPNDISIVATSKSGKTTSLTRSVTLTSSP